MKPISNYFRVLQLLISKVNRIEFFSIWASNGGGIGLWYAVITEKESIQSSGLYYEDRRTWHGLQKKESSTKKEKHDSNDKG